jgi:hypothetical protein
MVLVTERSQPRTKPESTSPNVDSTAWHEPARSGDRHLAIGWKQLVADNRALGIREPLQILKPAVAKIDQADPGVELMPDSSHDCR